MDRIIPAGRKPIGGGSYAAGTLAVTFVAGAALVVSALGSGNPDAVFAIPAFWMLLLPAWGFYMAVGWMPFDRIRRLTPAGSLRRLAFILLVLAPVVEAACILASVLFGHLWDAFPHVGQAHPDGPGLLAEGAGHWMLLVYIHAVAGTTCWSADQFSCLRSPDRSPRLGAMGALAATAALSLLPGILFFTANQYVVAYQARRAAGGRPYCILVPTLDQRRYVTPTRLKQLSPFNMRAIYQTSTGSRGGWWATDHALLVLDDPREILNWSYRSEAFRPEALLNVVRYGAQGDGRLTFLPCVPVANFTATLR